jgi:hypothetical protein
MKNITRIIKIKIEITHVVPGAAPTPIEIQFPVES